MFLLGEAKRDAGRFRPEDDGDIPIKDYDAISFIFYMMTAGTIRPGPRPRERAGT
jgi:hypothetical protein